LVRSYLFCSRHHRQRPHDRIIAATREYGYTALTRERTLLDYAGQGYLSALAC